MRFNYKIIPLSAPHPAYLTETSAWMPMLSVKLSVGHGPQTPRFEALIDSGASDTLFRADIGRALGLKIEKGIHGTIGGIVTGPKIEAYYHDIKLWVGASVINIRAGFSDDMSIAAILGRHGFFENFVIKFDPSAVPPGFDIERLGRT